MVIEILGNGGAICDGLPYNSFILDYEILVEVPPDIIQSLFKQNIAISKISSIFVSHFHGDHYFGIPFLALRQFFDGIEKNISIIGPKGIRERVIDLTVSAFGTTHPVVDWIKDHYVFSEIIDRTAIKISQSLEIIPLKMFHIVETYGFQCPGQSSSFTYFADSSWNEKLIDYISDERCTVLVDLNGEPTDKMKIHISESDLNLYALPYVNPETMFFGTHLKYEKKSLNYRIKFVKAGNLINV